MTESTLEQLCNIYMDLSDDDVQLLNNLASTLQMYADLSGVYMFIDCKMKDNEQAMVVAEAFPKTIDAIYENSVVGKIVFESFEPGVFYSYRNGKKSLIRRAITQEGRSVEQSLVPIKNNLHQVIGVLIQEKEVYHPVSYRSEPQTLSFGQESIDYVLGEKSGEIPMVSDLLMKIFLLTDHENKLTYANPVGVKFITEISHTEKIRNVDLVELLPFLKPIYNQEDDVFVFELTVNRKSLIVKKVRLRKK